MRRDIARIVIQELISKGARTTVDLQKEITNSGLPDSGHRYSVLRQLYLEPLRIEGVIRLLKESPEGEGGGVWGLVPRDWEKLCP